ncbi:MAG: type II toxin-antitoxin system VapC family toxin [Boseongicola sp. SB0675_bin_26]|nr:type II toxin-antitoxin system VapC family toxin [Boseongicola sp. SB0675_bin_26]
MKGFLPDTDVVSSLARPPRGETGKFADWLEQRDREGRVFLSVVAIHEIRKGIVLLEHKGATTKASALHSWLAGLCAGYADRVLELDVSVAEASGNAEARALTAGHGPGMADALVAGVAEFHNLVVMTRNITHFRALGVAAVTPEEVVQQEECPPA